MLREYACVFLVFSVILLFGGCSGGVSGQETINVERVFPNLVFNQPITIIQPPGEDSIWFLLEKGGRVLKFDNNNATAFTIEVIDLSQSVNDSGEGGLLGIAFHPSFSGSGDIFLYYTETGPDPSIPLVSNVSRFVMGTDGIIDSNSESVIFSIDQPETNHNGGDIKFGPDGFLYLSLGDGGGSGDPDGNAQDTTTLLGSMLRIDVDGGSPYAIPAGNVFASSSTDMPEIYAWGLRNPWRFSFDELTGDLWAGDVGQGAWEEIDLVISGGNYGWNIKEGDHCFSPPAGCDDSGLIDPVHEYGRTEGHSVTGGYVYRGSAMPAFQGYYFFADWVSGDLWGFETSAGLPEVTLLADTDMRIVSFAQDGNLELYVVDYSGGGIYRLVQTL
jgi:glucose/arabinose dehydrogenase